MKRIMATLVLLAASVFTSIVSAQEWMSWRSDSVRLTEERAAAGPMQEQSGANPLAQAPSSTATSQTLQKTSAKDNGIIGNPTPALALYVAQVEFAHKNCGLELNKQNERFYEWAVKRGLMLNEYREKDQDFAQAEEVFINKFQESWVQLDEERRKSFCKAYTGDVDWARDRNRLRILNVSDRFRSHFAPLLQERIDRAKRASIFAGVLSLGLTTAGINQASQHDFATASQFNTYGAAFAQLANDPSTVRQTPCESYLPFLLANVRPEVIVFDTYYSIRECSVK